MTMAAVTVTDEQKLLDLIHKLNKEFGEDAEEKLRFILSDISPPNKDKEILNIFREVKDRGKISVNKLDLLYELLELLGRQDLLIHLPKQQTSGNSTVISPYMRMLVDVGDYLESGDCQRLASSEGFSNPWKLFMHLEKIGILKNETSDLHQIEERLKEVGCNNAASLVKKYLDAEIVDRATKTLSDRYCRFFNCIKSLPWDSSKGVRKLKDIFINLNLIFEKEDYKAEFSFPDYDQIFDLTESFNGNRYRILIRGIAGTGKTTILHRLSLDWGESVQKKLSGEPEDSNDGVNFIKNIKLLFLIEIRKIKCEQTLFEAVHSQLLHDFSKEDIKAVEAYVRDKPSKAVFLLDGYDELLEQKVSDDGCKSNLLEALRCNTLTNCHVVVTTRPHRVKDFMEIHLFYKHFELKGFTREHVEQFVKRYFIKCPKSGDSLMKYIRDLNFVEGIAEIPIMTAIMCYLWESKNYTSTDLPRTASRLYKHLFKFLIKKYDDRNRNRIKKPRPDNILAPKDVLCEIGKIGLHGLENGKLIFKLQQPEEMQQKQPEEMQQKQPEKLQQKAIRVACEIGIMHTLNGDDTECMDDPSGLTEEEEVQFFHKSAQEKCAAIYLASLLEIGKSSKEFMDNLSKVSSVRNALDMHLMLKFACAESYEAAKHILTRLGEIYKLYSQDTWESFYKGDLKIEEIKEMQQFLELCIGCNFEADKDLHKQMGIVFPEGRIRFTGISNYTAMSLAYFLKYTGSIHQVELLHLGVEDNTQVRALMDKIPSCRRQYTELVTEISSKNEGVAKFANNIQLEIPEKSFLRAIPVEQMYGIYPLYQKLTEWQAKEINLKIVFDGMTEHVKSLTISGLEIKGTDLESFVELLQRLKSLESLCLNSNNLGPEDLGSLSECIGGMSGLKILTLSGNHVSSGFSSVLKHIQARRLLEIEEIWAEKCDLSPETLCETINAFDNTPNLRVLDIRLNEITNDVLKALAPKMEKLHRLENLNMTSNNVDSNGYDPFFKAIKQMNNMKRLHIADSTFSGTLLYHIATVIPELPNLEYLHASGKNVKEIREIPKQIFAQFIGNLPRLKALKELNLVIIRFRKEDFLQLISVCEGSLPKLTDLRISYDLVPKDTDRNRLPKFIKLC